MSKPLIERLEIQASMIQMGEHIAWGSDSAIMREAAIALRRYANPFTEQPAQVPLTEIQRLDVVTNWFSDEADITRALQMLTDFEQTANASNGIGAKP